ncbi:MAG: DNA-protecting protein DprA [Chitinophagaceae bacterium]|nr:DNA-protecting protein DprA [Chitinophagaceae bacterium]
MEKDLLYQIALSLVPNIGPVQAKLLLQHFEPAEIFHARKSDLERIEGIGSIKADNIKHFDNFKAAEQEISFIRKYGIQPLFITNPDYPQRLLNCYDSPIMLYYKGKADLNASRIVSVIGTRNNTEYGKQLSENFISGLSALGVLIVSGLAYGIDAIAHKTAIRNGLPTVGVLAHGLDQVYPSQHAELAKEMVRQKGGLLTEFRNNTKPDKHNFPTRNRLVAGMADATVVIETGSKGGSMITAELANGYNRDVFAFPGRVADNKSAGCNALIKNNKALLITEAKDLVNLMRWDEMDRVPARRQKELFIELSNAEKTVLTVFKDKEIAHIDEINYRSGLTTSAAAAAILSLEMQNVIVSLPGKLYRLD